MSKVAAEELRNRIRDFIGTAAGITGPFGSITWKKSKDKTTVAWEQVAAVYGSVIEMLMGIANPGDDPDTVRALALAESTFHNAVGIYTTTEEGTRRFHVSFKEEE